MLESRKSFLINALPNKIASDIRKIVGESKKENKKNVISEINNNNNNKNNNISKNISKKSEVKSFSNKNIFKIKLRELNLNNNFSNQSADENEYNFKKPIQAYDNNTNNNKNIDSPSNRLLIQHQIKNCFDNENSDNSLNNSILVYNHKINKKEEIENEKEAQLDRLLRFKANSKAKVHSFKKLDFISEKNDTEKNANLNSFNYNKSENKKLVFNSKQKKRRLSRTHLIISKSKLKLDEINKNEHRKRISITCNYKKNNAQLQIEKVYSYELIKGNVFIDYLPKQKNSLVFYRSEKNHYPYKNFLNNNNSNGSSNKIDLSFNNNNILETIESPYLKLKEANLSMNMKNFKSDIESFKRKKISESDHSENSSSKIKTKIKEKEKNKRTSESLLNNNNNKNLLLQSKEEIDEINFKHKNRFDNNKIDNNNSLIEEFSSKLNTKNLLFNKIKKNAKEDKNKFEVNNNKIRSKFNQKLQIKDQLKNLLGNKQDINSINNNNNNNSFPIHNSNANNVINKNKIVNININNKQNNTNYITIYNNNSGNNSPANFNGNSEVSFNNFVFKEKKSSVGSPMQGLNGFNISHNLFNDFMHSEKENKNNFGNTTNSNNLKLNNNNNNYPVKQNILENNTRNFILQNKLSKELNEIQMGNQFNLNEEKSFFEKNEESLSPKSPINKRNKLKSYRFGNDGQKIKIRKCSIDRKEHEKLNLRVDKILNYLKMKKTISQDLLKDLNL